MQNLASYLAWINLALVILVAVLALIWALRMSRRRRVKPASQIVLGLLPFVAMWGVLYISGLSLNPIWAVVAVVLGIGLGYLVSRSAEYASVSGRWAVKPSAAPPWVSAIGWMLVAIAVAFFGPSAVSATLLVPLLGATMWLTETVMHALGARKLAPQAPSAEQPPAPAAA
jgi:hypothetical protein